MKELTLKFQPHYRLSTEDESRFYRFIAENYSPNPESGIAVWYSYDYVANTITVYADDSKYPHIQIEYGSGDLSAIGAPCPYEYDDMGGWGDDDGAESDYTREFAAWAETAAAKAAWSADNIAFCDLCDSVIGNIDTDCAYWRTVHMAEDAEAIGLNDRAAQILIDYLPRIWCPGAVGKGIHRRPRRERAAE